MGEKNSAIRQESQCNFKLHVCGGRMDGIKRSFPGHFPEAEEDI